jgi:hypothetical protein
LAEHTDPNVRSESLRILAQWDKTGNLAEPQIYTALTAGDSELRADAISAIASSTLKSERMKTALLNIIGNSSEELSSRAAAWHALEHFPLTQDEYDRHSQITASLGLSRVDAAPPQIAAQSTPDLGSVGFSPFER